jgi:hypothetical protein
LTDPFEQISDRSETTDMFDDDTSRLDRALHAINERMRPAGEPKVRHSLVAAVTKMRARGNDFYDEYERRRPSDRDYPETPMIAPPSPTSTDNVTQFPVPESLASHPPPASSSSSSSSGPELMLEQARLFIDQMNRRDERLFALLDRMAERNTPAAETARVERLGHDLQQIAANIERLAESLVKPSDEN